MRAIDLEKLKGQIPERGFDELYAADVWFSMQFKAGYARALWNFTLALMDAEVDNFATAYQIAGESHDLTHLCGFHKLRFSASRWEQMRWFFTKLWENQKILAFKPGLRDYIEFVCENSRVRRGRYDCPLGLVGRSERLPWRTPEWHKQRYRDAHPLTPRTCAGCPNEFTPTHGRRVFCDACRAMPRRAPGVAPLSEFYPYITTRPDEDHALLLAVDGVVPRAFPRDVRGDLCQDLIVAVLSGEVAVDNLRAELPNYVRRFWRQFPSKYSHVSLDAPVKDGNGFTLLDVLSADDYADAYSARGHNIYGSGLDDCEGAEDLAERLRGAWEANRLTEPTRKTYGTFTASHDEDQRPHASTAVPSRRLTKHSNVRGFRLLPPKRAGIEAKLETLAVAADDYREARRAEELSDASQ